MTVPTGPVSTSVHLIEDHHQDDVFIDGLDSDQLRQYHSDCHAAGLPDHEHEG